MTADATDNAKESPKKTPANKSQPAANNATNKPAPKANNAASKQNTQTKREVAAPNFKQKTSKIGVFAFLLALIAAGGVGALGWLGYQQLETINKQLANTANEEKITQAVSGLAKQTQVTAQQEHLTRQLTQLKAELNNQLTSHTANLETINEELAAINLPQLQLRQLTEIEFLLQRAEVYGQQLKDPQAAIQLVELALASVKHINLSHKSKLIAQLETDLNQLTSQINTSQQALTKQLHLLAEKAFQLTSDSIAPSQHQPTDLETITADTQSWYQQAWQEVKNLIVIKELNQPLQILPFSPEEEAIKQQLNALLLQAATAANLGQAEVYLTCLEAAETRLNLLATNSTAAANFLAKVTQLKQQEVNPSITSLSASLNELAKLQASLNLQPED